MKEINLGTVQGRHEMPVEAYVLKEVKDPTDVDGIQKAVNKRMNALLGDSLTTTYSWHAANYCDNTDVKHQVSTVKVNLYVTGLTVVTLAVINWCLWAGAPITCWHYDRETEKYVPQDMWIMQL